jgi:uncharacterized protein (DUF1800 family)
MELHTLGVDGGYDANDIAELARIFTGWHESDGEFAFNDELHDNGDKLFLGEQISAAGVGEGEQVLDMLAAHPSTASYICAKLITVFVSDAGVESLQNQCAAQFLASDGDMTAVLTGIFSSDAFGSPEYYRNKVKTPLELVVATARGFAVSVDPTLLNQQLQQMGMGLFEFPVPTGFSETAADWLNTNALLQRIKLVNQASWQLSDAYAIDVKQLALAQGASSAETVVSFLFELALANDFGALEFDIALNILNADGPFDINNEQADEKLKRLLGTVLSLPGYQYQ